MSFISPATSLSRSLTRLVMSFCACCRLPSSRSRVSSRFFFSRFSFSRCAWIDSVFSVVDAALRSAVSTHRHHWVSRQGKEQGGRSRDVPEGSADRDQRTHGIFSLHDLCCLLKSGMGLRPMGACVERYGQRRSGMTSSSRRMSRKIMSSRTCFTSRCIMRYGSDCMRKGRGVVPWYCCRLRCRSRSKLSRCRSKSGISWVMRGCSVSSASISAWMRSASAALRARSVSLCICMRGGSLARCRPQNSIHRRLRVSKQPARSKQAMREHGWGRVSER